MPDTGLDEQISFLLSWSLYSNKGNDKAVWGESGASWGFSGGSVTQQLLKPLRPRAHTLQLEKSPQ